MSQLSEPSGPSSGGRARTLAMGTMRLSTEASRDEARALEVIAAALAGGVRLFDTADAYALDATDAGHNERLLARAIAAWAGDRAELTIVTKGGLVRPEGRWVADGRASHLRSACEASLSALGGLGVDLYLLHAPDPRTDFATSVRALARLREDGLVKAIGLSNVNVKLLEEARALAPIASVEARVGPFDDRAIRGGVVERALGHGARVLAYSPLGGPAGARRCARDPVLRAVAKDLDATPAEVMLAWLGSLHPGLVPLPGPTRLETVASCLRAARLPLSQAQRDRLDQRFPALASLRPGASRTAVTVVGPAPDGGEVVMIMGMPGAGKSTAAKELIDAGYARLNRDERGGRLAGVARALGEALEEGARRVVLDNTYVSRVVREPVIAAASRFGLPVRCVVIAASLEDAQVNACERMIAKHGDLLSPAQMAALGRSDPGSFPPRVQWGYRRDLEPPDASEGFAAIEVRPFVRAPDPARTRRALLVEIDGVLWRSRSGARAPASIEDAEIAATRADALRAYADEGWVIAGIAWRPEIEEEGRAVEDVERTFDALRERLGIAMEVALCPHGGGPQACWCRKPLPGLGVRLARRHGIALDRSLHVGRGAADRTFARALGMAYAEHDVFFAAGRWPILADAV